MRRTLPRRPRCVALLSIAHSGTATRIPLTTGATFHVETITATDHLHLDDVPLR